ncbi:MAG: VWA domain-containing protein, partial [Planctomycetes bacterium]|nr:VWA domain-containing protein [Planctomycetota bacterium]
VIDRSLSMRQEMASKSRAKSPEESRMHRAKEELKRALGLLTKEHRFNILSFAMTRRTFADGLVRPDRKTMKAALTFLDDMEMEFGTQIYDALQHAFQIAGRGAEDAFYDCEVDTIYLLTDGRPYVGNKSDSTRRIRNAARRWNALGRVRIHVIGLGTDIPAKFLQGLADDSGGRFVHETKAPEGKK